MKVNFDIHYDSYGRPYYIPYDAESGYRIDDEHELLEFLPDNFDHTFLGEVRNEK